ncbi:MAG: hypothetical protein ACI4TV_01875 [Paludibacteraceae bacterium]
MPQFVVHLLHALQMLRSGVAHLSETRIAQVNTIDSVYLQGVFDFQVAHQHLCLLSSHLFGRTPRGAGGGVGRRWLRSSERRQSKDGKEE